jgi:hypothetical protein
MRLAEVPQALEPDDGFAAPDLPPLVQHQPSPAVVSHGQLGRALVLEDTSRRPPSKIGLSRNA